MTFPHMSTKILLIGSGLRKIDKMVDTFNTVGADLLFADDAAEGLRMMCLENPDLVVCETSLPDGFGADLCRTMRSNTKLSRIPVIFANESRQGVSAVFDAMNAGADDYFSEYFDSELFIAKMIWMMEQKNMQELQRRKYEALRRRQLQTLDIVRETSELFRSIEVERLNEGADDSADHRIELGLRMIGGLADILDEQIRSLEAWHSSTANLDAVSRAASETSHGNGAANQHELSYSM